MVSCAGPVHNNRMLSDWFFAALQTIRKCGRYGTMKNKLLVLLFAFYSLTSIANADTLEEVLEHFANTTVKETQAYIEKSVSESTGKYFADIENRVSQQGTGNELLTRWRYIAFNDGSGFKIFLPIEYHYLDPKPDFSKYDVQECPSNMVSSGTIFIEFEDSKVFSHSWSCGSIGCSFNYSFSRSNDACN